MPSNHLISPHHIMSHNTAIAYEWMQEMERRQKKKRQEWMAQRRALWFWDLPFFDRQPAPCGPEIAAYDPGGIGVMG